MPREGLGLPTSAVNKATHDSLGEIGSCLRLQSNMDIPNPAFWGFLASPVPWVWETGGVEFGSMCTCTCMCVGAVRERVCRNPAGMSTQWQGGVWEQEGAPREWGSAYKSVCLCECTMHLCPRLLGTSSMNKATSV